VLAVVQSVSFDALLQGFAALASILGSYSGYAAFLALVAGDPLDEDEVGRAANIGLAIGFVPGIVAAVYLYQHLVSR